MKIMQVIPHFGFGGAEIMCENLTCELNKENEVVVLSLYSIQNDVTERMEEKGIRIQYLDKKEGIDWKIIKRIRKIIEKEKPEIIHTHLYSLKYIVAATVQRKVPIVHTVHSIASKEASAIDRILYYVFFRMKRVVPVSLSQEIKKSVVDLYKISEKMSPIILNGVDLERCYVKNDYVLGETIKIIHVGRFYEVKNHKKLLEAFSLITKKIDQVVLRLVGTGELLNDMIEYSKQLGIFEKVEFCGGTDNVFEYLRYADVFVLPSLWEGIPMSIIEAMGSGLPIVASDVGGIKNILVDKKNAILISPDKEEIARGILDLLENEELRRNIGMNARKDSQSLSSAVMAEKYLNVYKKTLFK